MRALIGQKYMFCQSINHRKSVFYWFFFFTILPLVNIFARDDEKNLKFSNMQLEEGEIINLRKPKSEFCQSVCFFVPTSGV